MEPMTIHDSILNQFHTALKWN